MPSATRICLIEQLPNELLARCIIQLNRSDLMSVSATSRTLAKITAEASFRAEWMTKHYPRNEVLVEALLLEEECSEELLSALLLKGAHVSRHLFEFLTDRQSCRQDRLFLRESIYTVWVKNNISLRLNGALVQWGDKAVSLIRQHHPKLTKHWRTFSDRERVITNLDLRTQRSVFRWMYVQDRNHWELSDNWMSFFAEGGFVHCCRYEEQLIYEEYCAIAKSPDFCLSMLESNGFQPDHIDFIFAVADMAINAARPFDRTVAELVRCLSIAHGTGHPALAVTPCSFDEVLGRVVESFPKSIFMDPGWMARILVTLDDHDELPHLDYPFLRPIILLWIKQRLLKECSSQQERLAVAEEMVLLKVMVDTFDLDPIDEMIEAARWRWKNLEADRSWLRHRNARNEQVNF